MSIKRKYIKNNSTARVRHLDYFLRGIVIFMSIIVLIDAFLHSTPLYYILFYFVGLVLGRIYRRILKVEHTSANDPISLKPNKWDIIVSVILLVIRFAVGTRTFEFMHVVWASDALYLVFIGIYRSKWKGIVKQIDEIIYNWASKA